MGVRGCCGGVRGGHPDFCRHHYLFKAVARTCLHLPELFKATECTGRKRGLQISDLNHRRQRTDGRSNEVEVKMLSPLFHLHYFIVLPKGEAVYE